MSKEVRQRDPSGKVGDDCTITEVACKRPFAGDAEAGLKPGGGPAAEDGAPFQVNALSFLVAVIRLSRRGARFSHH